MKKTFIALFAVIVFGGTASAQYLYGERSITFGFGTAIPLSPVAVDDEYTTITSQTNHYPMLSAMIRSQNEFSIDETFSWGYQYELNWIKYGADYEGTYLTQAVVGSFDRWDLRVDVRLTFGIYITDYLELLFAVGGGDSFLYGLKDHSNAEDINSPINFGGYVNVNGLFGVNYRFGDSFFACANLRGDIFSNNYFSILGGGNYYYRLVPMLGVGLLL